MTLDQIGLKYGTDKASNCHCFLDFYEGQFKEIKFSPQTILEIGVKEGASLLMWQEYFTDATIWGVDIEEVPPLPNIRTIQGDATTVEFIWRFLNNIQFDLIIDDGSHMTKDQIMALNKYWSILKPGGVFIMEDLHTSFLDGYINSPVTTYDYLTKNEFFRDHIKIFQRDPKKLTDSVTAMIFK